jgi:hypothetical protein
MNFLILLFKEHENLWQAAYESNWMYIWQSKYSTNSLKLADLIVLIIITFHCQFPWAYHQLLSLFWLLSRLLNL